MLITLRLGSAAIRIRGSSDQRRSGYAVSQPVAQIPGRFGERAAQWAKVEAGLSWVGHRAIADYGPDEIRLIRRCQVMATKVFEPEFLRPARELAAAAMA